MNRPPTARLPLSSFRLVALRLLPALVLIAVVVGTTWVTSGRSDRPRPQPELRPAAYQSCAEVILGALPPGFQLSERSLQALRDNYMASVETYTRGSELVRVYSGLDVVDVIDDVDFVATDVEAGGKMFSLLSTEVVPGLLVAQLEDGRPQAPCEDVGVETRNVTSDTMLGLLAGLEVRART